MNEEGKRLRLLVYTGITLLALCRTLWLMTSEPVRPLDWVMLVVEVAVLGLISYEVWIGERRHRRDRLALAGRIGRIREAQERIEKAESILLAYPASGMTDRNVANTWVQSARTWVEETQQFLAKFSTQAEMAFTSSGGGPTLNYGKITNLSEAIYWQGALARRLSNLQMILDRANVYFF